MCGIYGLFVMNINKIEEQINGIHIDENKLMKAKNLELQISYLEQTKHIYNAISDTDLSIDQVALLDNLNKIFPEDVYISEYTLDDGGKCTMYGRSKYEKNLGRLVDNLKEEAMFKNIQITYTQYKESKGEITEKQGQESKGVYSFQLTFDIEG